MLPQINQLAFLFFQISVQKFQTILKQLSDELEASNFKYSSESGCNSKFSSLFRVSSSYVKDIDDFGFILIL